MKRLDSVKRLFAGRWQIPMAVCAAVVAAVALYRTKPPQRETPFEAILSDVLTLAEGGAYLDAADAAGNLLEMDPPLSPLQRARLHDALADVIYKQELVRGLPNRTNAQLLLDHHHAAVDAGLRLDGRAALRAARAHEWLGSIPQALDAYRSVLAREAPVDTRRDALQCLVHLLDGRVDVAEERRGYIERLLEDEGAASAYLWSALRDAIREALEQDDVERAVDLLTNHGQRLKRSDLSGYCDYLWAWVHVHEGRIELALTLLDRVDQWQAHSRRVDADMDRSGFLPALSSWLRGRIELVEARPQEALASFDEVLSLQTQGELLIGATTGRAEALAMLNRHETAREAVRKAYERLLDNPGGMVVARPRLRREILSLQEARRAAGDDENAIAYLELAVEMTPAEETDDRQRLLEQLGRQYVQAAAHEQDDRGARERHAAGARMLEEASEMARLDEPRYAALIWESAEQYDQAGRTGDSQRMLRQFIAERAFDPRLPQAMLRLGRTCAAQGQLEQAIEHYDRLIEDFPRLEEASRALRLKATCLIALGDAHFAQAEEVLRDLLSSGDISPKAAVFRDALYELCDLLYQQRRYADAVSHIEDFLVFYPDDAELYRLRFMLADAYRGSAFALVDNGEEGAEEARRQVSRERLRRAAKLFEQCLNELEQASGALSDRDAYIQLALFNRGDCLYELNEPETLREALAIYRVASARYQGSPAVLAAQVRIANIYLRQGKVVEAARALERARWLLGGIPEGAFEEYDDMMDRTAWDGYLDAVQSSAMFQEVFSAAP